MKNAPRLLALAFLLSSAGCDTPSNLSTGVEQQPKTQYAQNPATLPTNPSQPAQAVPDVDSPTTAPSEDPDTTGSSHTPRVLDTDGGLRSDPAAAARSASPNKHNDTKPFPQ